MRPVEAPGYPKLAIGVAGIEREALLASAGHEADLLAHLLSGGCCLEAAVECRRAGFGFARATTTAVAVSRGGGTACNGAGQQVLLLAGTNHILRDDELSSPLGSSEEVEEFVAS